jgi:hypothetical protein
VKQPPKRYPKLEDGGMMADGGMVEKLTQAELLNQNFKEAKETIVEIHKRVKLKSGNQLLLLKKENGWGIAEYNPKSKKELDWVPYADKETANYWLDKVDVDKYASGGMMAKGGRIDDFSDKIQEGDIVWDSNNKRYGVVLNTYDYKYGEIRLDSDGNQPIEDLYKLGSEGDKGTKEKLKEALLAHKRLMTEYPDRYDKVNYAKGGYMAHGGVAEKSKLYYHKTSGGAEYLCSEKVKGTKDEGSLNSTICVRIDGAKTYGGELIIGAWGLATTESRKEKIKLYYHKTSGGAEYLCSSKVKVTKDEGRFDSKYIVRIDNAKNIGGELLIKMASGGYMADGGMTPLDVSNQIYDITVRIAELGDINTEAAYEETKNLMKMRAALQARALHLQDMEMAKGGYMADGGELAEKLKELQKELKFHETQLKVAIKNNASEKIISFQKDMILNTKIKIQNIERRTKMADGGIIYLESVGTYFRPSDLATSSEKSFSNEGEIVDLADIDNEEWFNALSEKDRATIEKYKAKGGYMAKGGATKTYYHILEYHNYGDIGYQGYYDTKEEATKEADRLSKLFPNLDYQVWESDKKTEPPITTLAKGGYMADGGEVSESYDIEWRDEEGDTYSASFDTYKEAKEEIKKIRENGGRVTETWKYKNGNFVGRFDKGGYMAHGGKLEVGDEGMYEGGEAVILTIDDKSYGYSYLDEDGKPKSQKMFAAKSKFENQFRVFPKYAGGGELHRSQEKYAYGRYMAMGGAIEHGLKKGDHIMVVRGNMLGIKNEITGEIVTLNIETGERKESKE